MEGEAGDLSQGQYKMPRLSNTRPGFISGMSTVWVLGQAKGVSREGRVRQGEGGRVGREE